MQCTRMRCGLIKLCGCLFSVRRRFNVFLAPSRSCLQQELRILIQQLRFTLFCSISSHRCRTRTSRQLNLIVSLLHLVTGLSSSRRQQGRGHRALTNSRPTIHRLSRPTAHRTPAPTTVWRRRRSRGRTATGGAARRPPRRRGRRDRSAPTWTRAASSRGSCRTCAV